MTLCIINTPQKASYLQLQEYRFLQVYDLVDDLSLS